ncbi:hypothetical protein F383_28740 [Gossypium arboreum]|uniref:Uncharacterized protein n=1 Tax=Gossypium arboreum TaxID=29729 RepID=A0A0B0PHC6_GOSAR|nr:hypothetical protein F383_28740 [Gossypium arboreum]
MPKSPKIGLFYRGHARVTRPCSITLARGQGY